MIKIKHIRELLSSNQFQRFSMSQGRIYDLVKGGPQFLAQLISCAITSHPSVRDCCRHCRRCCHCGQKSQVNSLPGY